MSFLVFILWYFKCRALEAKLAASRTGPGRVVWMSSLEARADVYDAEDWQLVDNSKPYEASKFEMDLIRAELSRRAGPSAPIRHFTVQPGVVNSSIDAQLSTGILLYIKHVLLYLVRLSPHSVNVVSSVLSCPVFAGSVVWFFAS